jgi:arylformamidase
MNYRVIDLSHRMEAGMPVFPGSPPVQVTPLHQMQHDGFNELRLELTTHTGTHLDTPFHLQQAGKNLDALPINQFMGTCLTVDCRMLPAGSAIPLDLLQPLEEQIRKVDFVLFHTGWSRHWGTPSYLTEFPVPGPETARFLASFELKGAGIDALSFDPVDSEDLPVHHKLLGNGLVLVENLVHLELLPETGAVFCCFPLPLRSGDGSPVRAVALL